MDEPKILFVVNAANFFLSHRLCLAEEALRRRWQVVVICAPGSGEEGLRALGLRVRTIPITRSSSNPWAELRTYRALVAAYREERPALVHHITIKPVIYGTWAASRCEVPAVVNAVPGLGYVYTDRGFGARARRALVNLLYRSITNHRNARFIFQNTDDRDSFVRDLQVSYARTHLVRGSGVDIDAFFPRGPADGPVTFVLVARMLRHKGVVEFVEAARVVARRHADWRFVLVGDVDAGNPSSLTAAQLSAWVNDGSIEWLGHRADVADILATAHVACLPSYREGLPKSLIEAAASGLPAIATDVPGCRDAVEEGVTGLLVPARSVAQLAAAMIRLGEDPTLRSRMGAAARKRAESLFAVTSIVEDTFAVYEAAAAT